MTAPVPISPVELDAPKRSPLRVVLLFCLLCAMVVAALFLFRTETGRGLIDRERLQATGQDVRIWVAANPLVAPAIFLLLYVTCAVLALPVWWLQILSGYAWGMWVGTAWSLTGHTCGSVVAMYFSRWLGGEWVRTRAGKAMGKFRRLSEGLGSNGLLVVLAARVCYVVPYGLSNYLFGITHIRARDAALGTILGGLPVAAGWVAIGASPGLLADWRFWAAIVGVNGLLLIPLGVRYHARRRGRRRGDLSTGAGADRPGGAPVATPDAVTGNSVRSPAV